MKRSARLALRGPLLILALGLSSCSGWKLLFPASPSPGAPSSGSLTSVECGRSSFGHDDCVLASAPSGGTFFSIWTKIPDDIDTYFAEHPQASSYSRGNMEAFLLYGNSWLLRCLVGDLIVTSSGTVTRYHANTMLHASAGETNYVDDYTDWQPSVSGISLTEDQARGWVWAAWQVVVGSSSLTIREWVKFGVDGAVYACPESVVPFTALKAANSSWTASDAVRFQVGRDTTYSPNNYSADYHNSYLCRARVEARSDAPSLDELNRMALDQVSRSSAWASYQLDWVDGAANLADDSGHGRNLSIPAGGTLYAGPSGPAL